MEIQFFLPMKDIPTITHQEKQVHVVKGKPFFYEPEKLKVWRSKLTGLCLPYVLEQPISGAVQLVTKWIYPLGDHKEGEYKITKPDTDNMIKLLKDCMTKCGFWKDDSQVASEITEKFYGSKVGIYIRIREL